MIYIAHVTETVENGDYYTKNRYANRGDRIYIKRAGKFEWKESALYHNPQALSHDLGISPDYRKARVLLSSDFSYIGNKEDITYKTRKGYKRIKEAIEALGRGHSVHHHEELRDQLLELKRDVWRRYDRCTVGKPTSSPDRRENHRSKSCGVVTVPDAC